MGYPFIQIFYLSIMVYNFICSFFSPSVYTYCHYWYNWTHFYHLFLSICPPSCPLYFGLISLIVFFFASVGLETIDYIYLKLSLCTWQRPHHFLLTFIESEGVERKTREKCEVSIEDRTRDSDDMPWRRGAELNSSKKLNAYLPRISYIAPPVIIYICVVSLLGYRLYHLQHFLYISQSFKVINVSFYCNY